MAKTNSQIQSEYQKRSGYKALKKYMDKLIRIDLKLNPDKDGDIISALDMDAPLAPQIKELIRKGL